MKSLKSKILVPIIVLGLLGIAIAGSSIVQSRMIREKSNEVNELHNKMESLLESKSWMEKTQKLLLAGSVCPMGGPREGCLGAVNITIENSVLAFEKYAEYEQDDDLVEEIENMMTEINDLSITVQQLLLAEEDQDAGFILGGGQMEDVAGAYDDRIAGSEEKGIDGVVPAIYEEIESVQDSQDILMNQMAIINIVLVAIAVVIMVITIISSLRRIIRPTVNAKIQLEKITRDIENNQGNLTARVSYNSHDEIETLVIGINSFLETLNGLINNIRGNANGLINTTMTMVENVQTTDTNAVNISAAMEELSATMQEVSATVMTVTENTRDINEHAGQLEEETNVMSEYSAEMAERANELKKTAVENKSAAEVLVQEILSTLKEAIENSKNVEQINSLTDEILSISSQTNLLALNASIEAARAGEAGKGFAVVADEIRVLADNSRNTANNIQAINSQVVEAVTALSSDSKRLIEFIDSNVLPDYDLLVNSGIQYSKDSDYISNGMNEFTDRTKKIQNMISIMNESIESINTAVEDGATGITNAAQDTAQLVNEINSISEETRVNREISERLSAETNRFVDVPSEY